MTRDELIEKMLVAGAKVQGTEWPANFGGQGRQTGYRAARMPWLRSASRNGMLSGRRR